MPALTRKQQQILDFIQRWQHEQGLMPTFQEIANHFGFRSLNSVTEHVRLLRQKGVLSSTPGHARSFRILSPLQNLRHKILDIPLCGSIPAGYAEDRHQEAIGCVSVDAETVGIKPTARTFALGVKGDSMVGRHILSGDTVLA